MEPRTLDFFCKNCCESQRNCENHLTATVAAAHVGHLSNLGVEEYVVDAEHVQPGEPLRVLERHVAVKAAQEQDRPEGEHRVVHLDA